ncbi:MAG: ATP-grasp domain-containing protein [Myxococcales bacterium]|nr:ATP-grasp domain-containing protein [Polyangiaceae bacterium]MDW8249971.1 ATP-grasp domain-containing protein [Myxococcales bacterium]
MNVVFLSPQYPPQYWLFCRALRERGVTVLGVGDTPPRALPSELSGTLHDYLYVPDMERYDNLLRALGLLVHRHGRIDHIDSLNEHWLGAESKLREDFNIPGMRPRETQRYRSKSGMSEVLAAAGIHGPPGVLVRSREQVEAFAREHGFPLIFKPDIGVGAEMTYRVDDSEALQRALEKLPAGFVVQRFIQGRVTTFDGLTDQDGNVIFAVSFLYRDGVMELIRDQLDVYFYTRRQIPEALRSLGIQVVQAFELRARFFHAEFFETESGEYIPLEINLRPPGGFTTDLMNYACDVDIYRLWARVITFDDVSDFSYEARYHAAHIARRPDRRYRVPEAEIPRLLGPALMASPQVPCRIAQTMGSPIFLVRHRDEDELVRLIELIQEHA